MGDVTLKDKKVLEQLLHVDIVRGKHSTGVAAISRQGGVEVFKRAVNPTDFYDMKKANSVLDKPVSCVIGHNRYATKGAVNNVNAHPFEFSHVVGAHNGTLTSTWSLDGHGVYEVDSECLYNHINERGIDDAFQKATGAFALTWYDSDTGNLNFLRNNQRPLCYCFDSKLKTLYWASEPWMLHGILVRNGIEYTDVVQVQVDTLYTFEVPKGVMGVNDKIATPKVRKLVKKVVNPVKKQSQQALSCITGGKEKRYTEYQSVKEDMLTHVGEEVEVYVIQERLDANKQKFIECHLESDTRISIRVYAVPSSPLWENMMTSVNTFGLKVRSYKTYRFEQYLLADLRSVKEIEFKMDSHESELTVEGYNGEKLLYKEFTAATSEGCSWCTGNAEFGKKTIFTTPFDFFCHSCVEDDTECREYLEGIGVKL